MKDLSDRPRSSTQPGRAPPGLQALFPAPVVVMQMHSPGDASLLMPAEAEYVRRAVPKRIGEFAAGRACARAALDILGVRDFALHAAADRQPVWPPGFLGSITHTAGFCAAAVAARRELLAIGLDSEAVGSPTPEIWSTICREEELTWLHALPESERAAAVTLLFTAKEAFYKCQYPLVGEWLDFHDVIIDVDAWSGAAGTFTARGARVLRVAGHIALPIGGRYLVHDGFLTAAVSVPASGELRRQ